MPDIKLSLCMITKNEADHIEHCLQNVESLVDEKIVVDTGSTDNTQRLARSNGSRVYAFSWIDDFAAARNESLKYATGDWILVLDADEVIAPIDHPGLRDLLNDKTAFGFALEQRNYGNNPNFKNWIPACGQYPEEKGYGGYVASPLIRLFRNDARIRFAGSVHELVEPSFIKHGIPHKTTAIPIHHYGKVRNPSRVDEKARLYLKIGENKARANPLSVKALNELAAQYLELRDFEKAAETYLKVVARCPGIPDPLVDLGVTYLRGKRLDAAESILKKAVGLDPDHEDALFNLGAVYLHLKRYDLAEDLLCRLIDLQPTTGNAYSALGSLFLCCNRIEEAVLFLDAATKYNKADPDLYSNLAWAFVQLGWREQALISCNKALVLDSNHKNASEFIKKASNMNPRSDRYATAAELNQQGEALFKARQTEVAETYFHHAVRIDPQCSEALNNLGVLSWQNQSADSAFAYFLRAFLINSRDPKVRANLLDCCEATGKHQIKKLLEKQDTNIAELRTTEVRMVQSTAAYPVRGDMHPENPPVVDNELASIFQQIYLQNGWGCSESKSGPGSTLFQTRTIRQILPILVKALKIKSLLDIPCGDFNWMKHVPLEVDLYIGADIVEELIRMNQDRYGSKFRRFLKLDITQNRLPKVDLIFCRDCFGHITTAQIELALFNIIDSQSKYLVTTTFPEHDCNPDIPAGMWRPVNLEKPPFGLPSPCITINENNLKDDGRFPDKSLGLWEISALKTCSALLKGGS